MNIQARSGDGEVVVTVDTAGETADIYLDVDGVRIDYDDAIILIPLVEAMVLAEVFRDHLPRPLHRGRPRK